MPKRGFTSHKKTKQTCGKTKSAVYSMQKYVYKQLICL